MSVLLQVLLMAALAGPGDAPAVPSRTGFDPALGGLEDLRRRTGGVGLDGVSDSDPSAEKKQQEENKKDRPETPVPPPGTQEAGVVDFEWLELQPRIGMAIFSKDYHIDPSAAFGILARVPITWLSPSSNPDGDYFGLFAQLDIAVVKRNIEPKLDKDSGPVMFLAFGIDYSLYRDETWMIMLAGGIQYGMFGGITDLIDGFAPIVALRLGVTVSRSVSLTFSPEYCMGQKGDSIILALVGAQIGF